MQIPSASRLKRSPLIGQGSNPGLRPSSTQELLLKAILLDVGTARLSWRELLAELSSAPPDHATSRILPLIHHRLGGPGAVLDAPVAGPGATLAQRAATAFHKTRYRNALLFDEAARAISTLEAGGVETCLLKGAALSVSAYADPSLRPMSDVDVLIRPQALGTAAEILRRAGWRGPSRLGPAEVAEAHSAPFTNETFGSIDVHWRSLDAAEEPEGDQSLWAASRPAMFAGVATRVPAAADLLLHACISGQRFGEDAGCRWVPDALAILGRAPGSVDWARVESEAWRHRESTAVGSALDYLKGTFEAAVPDDVVARLSAVRMERFSRLVSRARQAPPTRRGPLLATALHLDSYHRLSGAGILPRGPLGFFRSIARTWGLRTAWLVPFHAVVRGASRFSQMRASAQER